MNVFEKDLAGVPLDSRDPEVAPIIEVIKHTQKLIAKLNNGEKSVEQVREILSQIMGREVDSSLWLLPPFYTDFGRNIYILAKMFLLIPLTHLWIGAESILMMRCLSDQKLISSPLTTTLIPIIAPLPFASLFISKSACG